MAKKVVLDVINGDDNTETLNLLNSRGLVAGRDYDLIGMPPVAREIFPATPRFRIAEGNSFNLATGTYFGNEGILECLENLMGERDG
jgi:hypothetical protein